MRIDLRARTLVDDLATLDDDDAVSHFRAKCSTCSDTRMVISRSLRISFSTRAMSLMMDG